MSDKIKTALDIESDELLPDQKSIRNQEYNNLSSEAKQLISIILNSPKEILGMLPKNRSRSNRLTKSKCKLYLTLKWKHRSFQTLITKNLAHEVIEEISRWVKTL